MGVRRSYKPDLGAGNSSMAHENRLESRICLEEKTSATPRNPGLSQ